MTTVTIQQAQKRFMSLPPTLQDAIFSVQTAETIQRVSKQNHIPAEKVPLIAEATGLALLGFIHPEELAGEIRDRSGLNQGVSDELARALSSRIFDPLKDTIATVYAPAIEHETQPVPLPMMPRVVEEIKKPTPPGVAPIQPTPLKNILTPTAGVVQKAPPAPVPPATTLMGPGTPGLPPTPPSKPTPLVITGTKPFILQASGDGGQKPTTTPTATPPPSMVRESISISQPIPTKGPVLLQPDTASIRPAASGVAPLHIESTVPTFRSNSASAGPASAAKLELGKIVPPQPQQSKPTTTRTEQSMPRVIHYSQLKTPATGGGETQKGTIGTGPVSLSELTGRVAETPAPAATPGKTVPAQPQPPIMKQPPRPPVPPQQTATKQPTSVSQQQAPIPVPRAAPSGNRPASTGATINLDDL
jgi:hypothetical protein